MKNMLGNYIQIVGGGTPSRRMAEFWDGDIPWATVKDLKDDFELTTTQEYISEAGLNGSATRLLPGGTIVTATRMALGKAVILTKPTAINQDLKGLICSSELHSRYLLYFLHSKAAYLNSIGKGATVKGILVEDIQNLEIPIPPLTEQRRIVAILDKANAIRRKRRDVLALTDELLRSIFLDMFGDPVTNPKGWEKRHINEVAKVQGGLQLTQSRNQYSLSVPYLRVANVYRERLDLSEIKFLGVAESELQRVRLQKGDLLVVEGHGNPNEIGRAAIWDGSIENCIHQNHLIRIRPDPEKMTSEYICSFLNSSAGRQQMRRVGKTTSGLNTINILNVRNTIILIPPIYQQREFSAIKAKLDGIIYHFKKTIEFHNQLFNSCLQRAFKGEL